MLATRSAAAESTSEPRLSRRWSWSLVVESVSVLASPLLVFLVLKVRGMAPVDLPDPSMHTIYIVDPADMFTRYMAALSPTAHLREGAQAGFLVVARLAYLAFGAVPGFFVTRYLFALIAIVPAYVLVRRMYGIPAGALAIVALLSSPVIITAWGTDYPDSAVVSYVVGAVACLAIPCRDRWRPWWLAAAGVLLTLAVWSHGMGLVLAAATIGVYLVVRRLRDREHLGRDIVRLVAIGASVTLLLMLASLVLLGQFDFIRPTILAAIYLSKPPQVAAFHSSNPRWILYVAYLLVPPSVIAAFWAVFARKLAHIPTPQLFVGLACTGQVAVFALLQFFGDVETLEMHFFSSTLWGVVCLTLAVTLAELGKPLFASPWARWLPALLLVAVPLAYERAPAVPAFGWLPAGLAVAVIPVVLAGAMRLGIRGGGAHPAARLALGSAIAFVVVGMAGSLLVLTVA
ncbi:MAG TPA: glycosyltransferase family 39 protein, partial [Acidimicrobiales bacterium]|nr:glycosyltransferase family 39 protein [Acidimicrobiales bacterium]